MIIDTHAHIIVPEILRDANPAEHDFAWRPRVTWENGKQFVEYGPKRIGSATREFVKPEKILGEMKKSGVDAVLLCPWVSLVRYEAKAEESLSACQVQNDALLVYGKYPGQISPWAWSASDVGISIEELERIMQSGLKGSRSARMSMACILAM
jgi:hypothetical protein